MGGAEDGRTTRPGRLSLTNLLQRGLKRPLVRSVAVAATGTVGAQAISVLSTPILTRLIDPATYGQLGLFVALLNFLAPIAAFCYPMAIPVAGSDREAVALSKLSAWLAVGLSIGLICVLTPISLLSSYAAAHGMSAQVVFLFVFAIGSAALASIGQYWLIRRAQFRAMARIAILQSILLNAGKLIVAFLYSAAIPLMAVVAVGYAILATQTLIASGGRSAFTAPSTQDLVQYRVGALDVATRYSAFPKYRAPQNLINSASHSIPVALIAASIGVSEAGFYVLARVVLGVPSALVGKAVSDVLYSQAKATSDKGRSTQSIIRATTALAAVGVVPFAVIGVGGELIFELLMGSAWGAAGQYSQWLALLYFFNFINKPAVASIPVLGLQRALLGYEVVTTISKLVILSIGLIWLKDVLVAIALYSIVGAALYAWLILWTLRRSHGR